LFRITFNTAFLNVGNKLTIKRLNISPENLHKKTDMFKKDFMITLHFDDVCQGEFDDKGIMQIKLPCRSHYTALQDICSKCRDKMPDEIKNWEMAHEILKNHNYPTIPQARKIIKNQEQFIAEGKNKVIIWNSDDYKIGMDYFEKKHRHQKKHKTVNQLAAERVMKFNKIYEHSGISKLEQVEEEKYPANEEEEEKEGHLRIQDKDPLRELRENMQGLNIGEEVAASMIEKKAVEPEQLFDQSRAPAKSIMVPHSDS